LEKQFNDFLMSKNLDPLNMSKDQKKEYENSYIHELYPGATISPYQMINTLNSANPTKTIQAKIVTDPHSVCVDVPETCEAPWFEPLQKIPGRPFCLGKFDKTTANDDLCAEAGGETIYFTQDFGEKLSISLSEELTKGIVQRSYQR
jgi:hypothetical protein